MSFCGSSRIRFPGTEPTFLGYSAEKVKPMLPDQRFELNMVHQTRPRSDALAVGQVF
jgi:hypothetical protein